MAAKPAGEEWEAEYLMEESESESDAEGGAVEEVGSSDEEGDGARSRSPRSSPFSSRQWPQSYSYGLFPLFLASSHYAWFLYLFRIELGVV